MRLWMQMQVYYNADTARFAALCLFDVVIKVILLVYVLYRNMHTQSSYRKVRYLKKLFIAQVLTLNIVILNNYFAGYISVFTIIRFWDP